MKSYIVISPHDNVAVALTALKAGTTVEGIELKEDVERGHKLALRHIAQGEQVIKYGYPIGIAQRDIEAGEWVHSHNLRTGLEEATTPSATATTTATTTSKDITETYIQAYLRPDGRMGVRNELWIIPTVGCIVGQAEEIKRRLIEECKASSCIDDVVVLGHNYGCSQLADDHAATRRALAALACHPNAGGVLLLGLGCENNQMEALLEEIKSTGLYPTRMRHIVAQEVDDEVECGLAACREMLDEMLDDKRQPLPLSMLRVGLKCGGSDGLSGITANPLLGRFTDWLTAQGGTAVLTEVPEMFGAEHLLIARTVNDDVHARTVKLVEDFKEYFSSHGQPIYENPSPGNRAGGITTLEEKSLGCVQKGGMATVTDVLPYGHTICTNGLNLLSAPGNDLVASTALAMAGCHIILFTTGRGTPFGAVVPTMKVATNSALAATKPQWIDFNAGVLIEDCDPDAVLQQFVQEIIAVACGKRVHHELVHSKQVAIFKTGVTL